MVPIFPFGPKRTRYESICFNVLFFKRNIIIQFSDKIVVPASNFGSFMKTAGTADVFREMPINNTRII